MVNRPVRSALSHEVRREPMVRCRWIVQKHQLTLHQVRDVRDGVLEDVGRQARMAAVEVPAVEKGALLWVDQGVVVDAVHLGLEELAAKRQRVQ